MLLVAAGCSPVTACISSFVNNVYMWWVGEYAGVMNSRIHARSFLSRVNEALFGQTLDQEKVVNDSLRKLMSVESVLSEKPQLFVVPAVQETTLAKERALASKLEEMSKISDKNLRLLNSLLPSFNMAERAKIISDVSSHMFTNYQTTRYLMLLKSVADLGNDSGIFADDTFFDLVRGLRHAIKRTDDSYLLGDREQDMEWSEDTDLSGESLRVRFGLRLHIIAKTTYSEPLAYLFRPEVKELGLILRDPTLETVLIRRPDRMEDIYDLLMVNYMTTGNRIASILDAEDRLIKRGAA